MSQPPKKSGSRDINELKARLGLKKSGATAKPNGSPTGGVVPPPGLAVPPPPGAGPPKPAVPDAADDPFGAMNAMAQMGAAQRAPEIVIVNDGKPVESVSAGTRAATIGKYAAIALVPFVIGILIRGVSKDASAYNDGIRGAKVLLADVKALKRSLSSMQDKANEAIRKNKGPGKELSTALTAIDKIEVNAADALKRKQNIGADLAGDVMAFYAGASQLKDMIDAHLKAAKADDLALATTKENGERALLPDNENIQKIIHYKYGVLVWNPSEEEMRTAEPAPFGARLVELGPPYCDGKLSTTGKCPEGVPADSLAFRTSPGGQWQRADFAIPDANVNRGDPIPSKKILIMSPTEVFEAFVNDCANGAPAEAGTPNQCVVNVGGSASKTLYDQRLAAIMKLLADVIDRGNKLEGRLAPKANEKEQFTFFM